MKGSPASLAPGKAFALRTYRWEGTLFNFLCAVYFVVAAPHVVTAADAAMRDPEARPIWLGILIVVISLAEIYAFPVKMRFVNEAIRDQGDAAGRAFYLWMFHAVISVILVFLVAGCFGVKAAELEDSEMPWWLVALLPVTVIKELVFLGFLWGGGEGEEGKRRAPNPSYTRPSPREWIADAILVVYACVAYSATWSAITKGMDLERGNPVMFVVNLGLSALLFLIFYLPLRIPYWIEEMAQVKTGRDSIRLVASILVVLVPAIGVFW